MAKLWNEAKQKLPSEFRAMVSYLIDQKDDKKLKSRDQVSNFSINYM
jgi:hypothetical protein